MASSEGPVGDAPIDVSSIRPGADDRRPPTGRDEPAFGTTGIDDDLHEASRAAIRRMIDHRQDRGLTREQAYILCSAGVDLKTNEAVNAPNRVVSVYLPASGFPETLRRSTGRGRRLRRRTTAYDEP